MHYLTGKQLALAEQWVDEAAEQARQATCVRANCGAVLVAADGTVIGRGFNGPPQNDPRFRTCLDEYQLPQNFRHDRTCCIHAEQRAVDDALRHHSKKLAGATFYFVRTDQTGEKLRADKPKCTICSRLTLEHGLMGFVLWDDNGYAFYPSAEFNRLSYLYSEQPDSR